MRGAMVALALVSCLGLGACAGGSAGTASGPSASIAPAAQQSGPPSITYVPGPDQEQDAKPAKPAPKPRNSPRAAYRGNTAPPPAPEADHVLSGEEQVMQTKTDCWMAVDRAKGVGNDIDKRM